MSLIRETGLKLDDSTKKALKRYLQVLITKEFVSISRPCYKPRFSRIKNELIQLLNYSDSQAKVFLNQFSPYIRKFGIIRTNFTSLVLSIILESNKPASRDIELIKLAAALLALRSYSSAIDKSFPKFCSPTLWIAALKGLSHSHLFTTKGGPARAVLYLTQVVTDKYINYLKLPCDEKIILKFVAELRGRVKRSFNSFAEKYYALQKGDAVHKEVSKIKAEETEAELSHKLAYSMCVLNDVDEIALNSVVKKLPQLNVALIKELISAISRGEYKDNIQFIYTLFSKLTGSLKDLCSEMKSVSLLRKILAGARVSNYKVSDEIIKILSTTETFPFIKQNYNDNVIVTSFVYYLVYFARRRIC